VNTDFTCVQCHDLLPGYVAGTLSEPDIASIERHVSHCAACQDELAQWCRLSNVAHRIDAVVPPAGAAVESATWATIQAQLPSESSFASGVKLMEFDNRHNDADLVTSPTTPSHIDRRPRRRNTFMASVAAILLVALGAAIFALHPQLHSSTPGSGAKATKTPSSTISADDLTSPTYKAAAIIAPNDIWAVGQAQTSDENGRSVAVISHFDGTKWSINPDNVFPSATPTDSPTLTTISCGSPTDCWTAGTILAHFTQDHWTKYTVPPSHTSNPGVIPALNGVQMFSATDGWGWKSFPLDFYHFTNGVWNEIGFQFDSATATSDPSDPKISEVKMVSDTEGWAIGSYKGRNALWHYLNGTWHTQLLTHIQSTNLYGDLSGIGVNSANDVWLIGLAGGINGLAFSGKASNVTLASERPFAATPSGPNLAHYDGQTWTTITNYAAGYPPFLDGANWLVLGEPGARMLAGLSHNLGGHWVATNFPSAVAGGIPNDITSVLSVSTQPNGDAIAIATRGYSDTTPGYVHTQTLVTLRFSNNTWSVAG
jgi:hypothetical protein